MHLCNLELPSELSLGKAGMAQEGRNVWEQQSQVILNWIQAVWGKPRNMAHCECVEDLSKTNQPTKPPNTQKHNKTTHTHIQQQTHT